MLFRQAVPADIPALVRLRWEHEADQGHCNGEAPSQEFAAVCSAFLTEALADAAWVIWVAEDSGRVIGNIFVKRIRKVPKPHRLHGELGYLTNAQITADYRNAGVGTQLLQAVVAWARGAGLEGLFLWPSERAVSFYERQGFRTENEIMELLLQEEP